MAGKMTTGWDYTRAAAGVLLAATLFAAGCSRATVVVESPAPLSDLTGNCTSLCIDNGDHCVFGTNMDHRTLQGGYVFVNKRNVQKTAWEASESGEYARWVSRYGSVTFNAIGVQMAWGGMNEAGLMISTMSLVETTEPSPDNRLPLAAPLWVQYELDMHDTIQEVIASDALVRPTEAFDHYLVCERSGQCAVIEFLDGQMTAHAGVDLPVKALANSTYEDSLAALADGNYWKVEAIGVSPEGPAAAAGVMAEDWITAVDGVELAGGESLQTLHAIIAQHQPGDEVTFTVVHPGETEPVVVKLTMAPLPEDLSRYVLPEAVPVQILSLGFIPKYPGNFLTRFATAADWVTSFVPASAEDAVDYAFDALEAVSEDDTVWSAVFDPANMTASFRSKQNPHIRHLDFAKLDFSCQSPVQMLDVHTAGEGDITQSLHDYVKKEARAHAIEVTSNMWQVDVSSFYVEALIGGVERCPCLEGQAAQGDVGGLIRHDPLLPPYVPWAARAAVERYWPAWAALHLLCLAVVVWRLSRIAAASRREWRLWVPVVALFGPFGLVAYWAARRRGAA